MSCISTCGECKRIILEGDKHDCQNYDTPETSRIIHELIKKFCQWRYNPMAMCEQPDINDAIFRAAEWLTPILRKMERREN